MFTTVFGMNELSTEVLAVWLYAAGVNLKIVTLLMRAGRLIQGFSMVACRRFADPKCRRSADSIPCRASQDRMPDHQTVDEGLITWIRLPRNPQRGTFVRLPFRSLFALTAGGTPWPMGL